VFSGAWIDEVAAGIDRSLVLPSAAAESLRGSEERGAFYNDYCNWRRIPEFRRFVYESPVAAIAGRLMESDEVVFYHEHVLIKEPGALKPSPWHHDQPYYPVDGWQNCSIWLPVDPVAESASLRFVRGSHAWGKWFMPRKFATQQNYHVREGRGADRDYATVPDIDGDPTRFEILTWALEPGDCIAFHMRTLHGAAGNDSLTRSRRVLATRWLGADARFAERPWEVSPPVTGGLCSGAPMACEEFPRILPRE
jgi:ectoine hydroxylase-related dioxygenase (phytanoyl-CoA dioxygenase family)